MRYFVLSLLLVLPLSVLAQQIQVQQYQPLVNIPLSGSANSFNAYINALYGLSISIAALLAVIKMIIAGVKWMMTDVVTSKSDAKRDIQGALLGLLVVLAAVLILTVINPQINNVSITTSGSFPAPTGTPNNPAPQSPYAQVCVNGCTPVQCSMWTTGLHLTCGSWCSSVGGVYQVTHGTSLTTNRCWVPQNTTTILCQRVSTGTWDCAGAISQCTSGVYSPQNAGTLTTVPHILCI